MIVAADLTNALMPRIATVSRMLIAILIVSAAPQDANSQDLINKRAETSYHGFRPYEDSFIIRNRMRNNGWAKDDESALPAHFSFKYSFCGPRVGRGGSEEPVEAPISPISLCPTWAVVNKAEIFVAYTGEFDFYLGTRASGPVINRLSVPGAYVRLPLRALPILGNGWEDVDSLEIGYEHRSNGQVTEVTGARGTEIARANYAGGNREYFDTISRSANYFTLAIDRRAPLNAKNFDLNAKLRFVSGSQDSNVTWGPLADAGHRLSSYDRLELRASYRLPGPHRVDVQWRVGDKGLSTDSWTFGWLWNIGELPLYFRYHRGPMNTLSNYTQRQDSFGVGLLLSRF
jgi:outer membrane phospholipase A